MPEQIVLVTSKPTTVNVYQKTKWVWIAVGDYEGERIEVRGQSESAAVRHWQSAALYKTLRIAKRSVPVGDATGHSND